MCPNNGRTERNHPNTIPAMSAPPAVDSVSGTPFTLKTSEPSSAPSTIAAPMNATSATSVRRSATPSSLVAALMSCVRPTRVRMSPRWILVFGRMGISVAVAPRVIFRRKTPRDSGRLASSSQRLAVDRLVCHVDVNASHRHVQKLRVLDFLCAFPDQLHEHVAGTRDRHHVTLLQDGIRGCLLDHPIATDALDEDARVRHQRLGLNGPEANNLPARLHAERAQHESVPGRAKPAHFLLAAVLVLVGLAGGRQIDAEQLGAKQGDDDRRTHRAEHVSHGVGDRHRIDQGLGLVGGHAQAVDGVGREPHRGRERLRP